VVSSVALLQPHERSSETPIRAAVEAITELQPHERSSETLWTEFIAPRGGELQPHERSSETR